MMRFAFVVLSLGCSAYSATYFVDPENGRSGADGLSAATALASVNEALGRCQGKEADEIRVAPGVNPLREEVVVLRKQYAAEKPLVIDLGGRWIAGSVPVDRDLFKGRGGGLWVAEGFTREKPFHFLVINGRAERMGRGRLWSTNALPPAASLSNFQWTLEGDDLVVKIPESLSPAQVGIERSRLTNGVSIHGGARSSHVTVRNARVKFMANDGFNLHGPVSEEPTTGIRFEAVRSDWNWDQGISSHDTCESVVEDATMIGNVAGLVHIQSSRTIHRRLLLAESGGYDLHFYGNPRTIFEDCYVSSTTGQRQFVFAEKSFQPGAFLHFSNSVFHLESMNPNPWSFRLKGIDFRLEKSTFWLDSTKVGLADGDDGQTTGLVTGCIVRAEKGGVAMAWGSNARVRLEKTLFDGAGVAFGTNRFLPPSGAALRASGWTDERSGFCKRLDASPFPGSARLEGLGAAFPPEMAERVRQYRTGELLGGGFALIDRKREGDSWVLTFNRPVDPLSLPGGVLVLREGKPVAPVIQASRKGDVLTLQSLRSDDVIELTTELRSDLGPVGLREPVRL